jgi:hypothetical protein
VCHITHDVSAGAESFVTPPVIHGIIKTSLSVVGVVLGFLGLRSSITFGAFGCEMHLISVHKGFYWGEAEECADLGPAMITNWFSSVILLGVAMGFLDSKMGRKFIIYITNLISRSSFALIALS